MEEINTVFSDHDHSFFNEAMKPSNFAINRFDDDDESKFREKDPSMYDPPSKICGGAVFNKFRKMSKNNNAKEESLKKKVQYNPQINQNENTPKFMTKFKGKMMKRNKKSDSTATEETTSFKTSVLVEDSTPCSSISNPSLSSDPWLTDNDDNVRDYFVHQPRFEKEVMGESTAKYTNQSPPSAHAEDTNHSRYVEHTNHSRYVEDTNHSRQSLQIFLKEMKDLNCRVQENSNVLQKGIEKIALELEQENNQPPPPQPPAPKQNNDDSEIETLRQERSYYRSEAETLRMEMKEIKEQLSEIRKYLPKMENSFDIPSPQKSIASTAALSSDDSESMGIPQFGEKSNNSFQSEDHNPYLETIDYTPMKDPKLSYRSDVREALSTTERRVSESEHRAQKATSGIAVRDANELVQYHHNQPIRTTDNNPDENRLGAKPKAPIPPPQQEARNASPISRRFRHRSASPIGRRIGGGRSVSPMSRGNSSIGSSGSDSRGETSSNSEERQIADKKNSEEAIPKSFYAVKRKNSRYYSSNSGDEGSERRNRIIAGSHSVGSGEERELFNADTRKKYREMRRSLHKETINDVPMNEITTANRPNDGPVVSHNEGNQQPSKYSEGDVDDEYLEQLRKSWYQKQTLALADSSNSSHSTTRAMF